METSVLIADGAPNSRIHRLTQTTSTLSTACRPVAGLFFPVCNPPACQVVRGQFDSNLVARQDLDKELSHSAGDVGKDLMIGASLVQGNAKHGVWQRLGDRSFNHDFVTLLFSAITTCVTRLLTVLGVHTFPSQPLFSFLFLSPCTRSRRLSCCFRTAARASASYSVFFDSRLYLSFTNCLASQD